MVRVTELAIVALLAVLVGVILYGMGARLLSNHSSAPANRLPALREALRSLSSLLRPNHSFTKLGQWMVQANGAKFQERFINKSLLLQEINPSSLFGSAFVEQEPGGPASLSIGLRFAVIFFAGLFFVAGHVLSNHAIELQTNGWMDDAKRLAGIALGLVAAFFLLPRLHALHMHEQIDDARHRLCLRLPSLLDLWVIGLESGQAPATALLAALDQSRTASYEALRIRLKRDLDSGLSVPDALASVGNALSLPSFHSLGQILVIAVTQGGPIVDRLKQFAEQLRQDSFLAAENDALKAPLRLLAPLVLLIFPSTFIVLLFPVFYQLSKEFGG